MWTSALLTRAPLAIWTAARNVPAQNQAPVPPLVTPILAPRSILVANGVAKVAALTAVVLLLLLRPRERLVITRICNPARICWPARVTYILFRPTQLTNAVSRDIASQRKTPEILIPMTCFYLHNVMGQSKQIVSNTTRKSTVKI